MNAVLQGFVWVGAIWMVIACIAVWRIGRPRRKPALPQRTAADVAADVDIARACRHLRQAIDDYDAVWAICPDPANTRLIELQHRLNQHRKGDTP